MTNLEIKAFRSIGWKFYLLFIILAAIGAVWVAIFVPETKGIPLEEIAQIFGDEVTIYGADICVDAETHELVEHYDGQGTVGATGTDTRIDRPEPASNAEGGVPAKTMGADHIETPPKG